MVITRNSIFSLMATGLISIGLSSCGGKTVYERTLKDVGPQGCAEAKESCETGDVKRDAINLSYTGAGMETVKLYCDNQNMDPALKKMVMYVDEQMHKNVMKGEYEDESFKAEWKGDNAYNNHICIKQK